MNEYIAAIAGVGALTWAGSEGVGRLFNVRKDQAAAVLGPVLALAGHGAGLVPGEGIFGWILAGAMGFASSMAAGVANDYIVKTVQAKGKKRK